MENCLYVPKGYKIRKKEIYVIYDEKGKILGEFYEPVKVKEEVDSMPRLEPGMFGCTNDGDCFVVTILENKRFLIYMDGSFDCVEDKIKADKENPFKIDYLFKGVKSFDQVKDFIRLLECGRDDLVGGRLVWTRF